MMANLITQIFKRFDFSKAGPNPIFGLPNATEASAPITFGQAENTYAKKTEISTKWRGKFQTLLALTTGVINPLPGDTAQVDAGIGHEVINYFWDTDDNVWVLGSPINNGVSTSLDVKAIITLTANTTAASSHLHINANGFPIIFMNSATANTFTIDSNLGSIGNSIILMQVGIGQTSLAPAGGVTINSAVGLKLTDKWSAVTLIKTNIDIWVAIGRLSA